MAYSQTIIDQLKTIVGEQNWLETDIEKAAFLVDERRLFYGQTPLIVFPTTTEQVADIVALCHREHISIVPQGGNTGYAGGATPRSEQELLICLAKLNHVREIDPLNYTMTVEAGCILADVQQQAKQVDRFFPLSLGAEGSCQMGGVLSTNAGGMAVLRYGNARELVLGLEVVLPNGQIWHGLRKLRKDNSGYDVKQLFIGAEGTLGIITAATLKLFPKPCDTVTAFVAVETIELAVQLLTRLRSASGDDVSSFEYIHHYCVELVARHFPHMLMPFEDEVYEHYVLFSLSTSRPNANLQALVEEVLEQAFEAEEIINAIVATSNQQAEQLWQLREHIPAAQKLAGSCIKHDIAVPISHIAQFMKEATKTVKQLIPNANIAPFGHIGDGNIHFNIMQPVNMDSDAFLEKTSEINKTVHDLVMQLNGSFSAEHGIGQLKTQALAHYKSDIEYHLMKTLKAALDPENLMNPGKVLCP